MSTRETFKTVEIGGRKFRLEKFDALTGSFLLFTLMQKFLPAVFEGQLDFDLPKSRTAISKEEFQSMQGDCLKVVSIITDKELIPVLDLNGFLQEELQKDTLTVMALTAYSLKFNLESFFSEESKAVFGDFLQNLNLADVPM